MKGGKMSFKVTKAGWLVFSCVASTGFAWGETLTLSDLQGATISLNAVHRERLINYKYQREVVGDLRTSGKVTIGPGDTIKTTFTNAFVWERGTKTGTRSGAFTLGKPQKNRVGDDVVWLLDANRLIRLRVYGAGTSGQKLTITFTREAGRLHCVLSMPFARENGVGDIDKGAATDNAPIKVLSWTQVSSTCEVSKEN
jgi:hypothetical protein